MNIFSTANHAYYAILYRLFNGPDRRSTTRKGEELSELLNYTFTLKDPMHSFASIRSPSSKYLEGEFEMYMSGDNSLERAAALSPFWRKVSDDGKTINSNYGKLLFYDKNAKGLTQAQHALNALETNIDTKKAVMVIYSRDHAYISKDNPCTMFLHLYASPDSDGVYALHMHTYMRSNDVFFGLTYDMPFFCGVLYAFWRILREGKGPADLRLGTYTHSATTLHKYARDDNALSAALRAYVDGPRDYESLHRPPNCHLSLLYEHYIYKPLKYLLRVRPEIEREYKDPSKAMMAAWKVAGRSKCLKKKVGAVLVHPDGSIIGEGHGGREGGDCTTCAREEKQVFYADGCWSVHSEMRAIHNALENGASLERIAESTMYVTHGPCDQCMKHMHFFGIRKVFYDKPYKTDLDKWRPLIDAQRYSCPDE